MVGVAAALFSLFPIVFVVSAAVNPLGTLSSTDAVPTGFTFSNFSGLFKNTADAETGHAHGHLDFLKAVGDPATDLPIGETAPNLKASVAGETYEYTEMYPGMARTARDEGLAEVAEWFETLAKAEKSHAGRFQKALDTLEKL